VVPALVLAGVMGVVIGSTPLPWQMVVRVVGLHLLPTGWIDPGSAPRADDVIVWLVRLPRVLVATVVGAGLATAGALMQGLFRNPLAEPSLTGVGPGAVLGAVIVFVTGWGSATVIVLPVAAMVSACAALLLVYYLARSGGPNPITALLLAGIGVGACLTAVSSLLISVNIVTWDAAREIVFWMMGGLDSRTWAHVWLSAPFVAVGMIAALLQARTLDVLALGDDAAMALGVDVASARRLIVTTSAVLTGASVAVAGLVGFVGLVVPHAVRLVVGPRHRTLIPASALAGAVFVVLCDLAARTLRPPAEIRLGVVTALCGAPLFLTLLLRRARGAV
jgi:iron complex transport system permease protein